MEISIDEEGIKRITIWHSVIRCLTITTIAAAAAHCHAIQLNGETESTFSLLSSSRDGWWLSIG